MKLGNETGSLVNHLLAQGRMAPEIGMGATICAWSDRSPATIIKITKSQVHVQCDDYKRIDKNGMSEIQEYEYKTNPDNSVIVFRMTKNGLRSKSGYYLSVGRRERYYDFSF